MNKKTFSQLFLLMSMLLVAGCDREQRNTEKPKETITLERAHAMYNAYQKRFDAITDSRGGQEDARFGWHDINFYKNYIAYLEEASKKVNMKVSGLRLYYVAYPDDDQAGKQRDYQTYIFVPTYYDKKTDSHIAFDPLHIDERGNPLPIHDIITTGGRNSNRSVSKLLTGSNPPPPVERASSIANMAQMCRPNCSE